MTSIRVWLVLDIVVLKQMHLILLIFSLVRNRVVVKGFRSGFVLVCLSKTLRVETRPRWVV